MIPAVPLAEAITHWGVADWSLLIGAIATAIVLIINAIGAFWGRKEARQTASVQTDKLDVIHDLTNSSMTALKAQLAAALSRIGTQDDRILKLEELLRQKRTPTGDGTT